MNVALSNTTGTLPVNRGGTGITAFTGSQIFYANADGTALVQVATSSLSIGGTAANVTTNANLSGVVTSVGNTTSYGSQTAGVLGTAATGNTAPMATSTLYGTSVGGQVLGWSNVTGGLAFIATSTNALTATTLQTARTINGVSFNGSINIVVASTTLLGDTNTWTNTQGMSISGTAANVTGTVAVATGGTGITSVADGSLLFGSPGGTAALTTLATSTLGGFLSTSYTTGRPLWSATSSTLTSLCRTPRARFRSIEGGTGITAFTGSQIFYANADGTALVQVATSSLSIGGTAANVTTNANLSGVVTSVGNTTSYPTTAGANTVLANSTGAAGTPSFVATSTLFNNSSASITGLLSSTDWSTFNSKLGSISGTFPITVSGSAISFGGLSTSTAAVVGNIPYFSGTNTFANVATTTFTPLIRVHHRRHPRGICRRGKLHPHPCHCRHRSHQACDSSGQHHSRECHRRCRVSHRALYLHPQHRRHRERNVTGIVALANGGTGLSSVTGNRLLYSNSAGTALLEVATSSLSIGGNAATVTTLQTARTINGVSFNGSANDCRGFNDPPWRHQHVEWEQYV